MSNFDNRVGELKKQAEDAVFSYTYDKIAEAIEAPPLNDKEQRVFNRLQTVPGLVVAHGLGTGKALHVSEPTLTDNGFVPIGELKIGDKIFDETGSLVEVSGVYPQGKLPLFNIEFSDGIVVKACQEHLWLTQTHKERKNYKRTKYSKEKHLGQIRNTHEISQSLLTTNNELNHSIKVCDKIAFSNKPIKIDPYFLGILLGDGHFHKKYTNFTTTDTEIIDSITALLPNGYALTTNKISYTIVNRQEHKNLIHRYMLELKLRGKRAWEKFIPKEYLYNSIENRVSLLQGLIDSDGEIDKRGCVSLSTTSEQLSSDLQFLVNSLGGIATITYKYPTFKYKGQKKKGRKVYRIWINLPNDVPPCRLSRKLIRVKNKTKYFPIRYIKQISQIEDGEAVCITVNNDSHLFLTRGCIPTHNTRTSIQVANQLKQPTNVVVPASLQDNYKKELNKWVGGVPDYMNIQSQQRVGRSGLNQANNNGLLIVDEAHRARDPNSSLLDSLRQTQAKKRLLLTATPVYNHPADIAPLINIAANKPVLPEGRQAFNEAFVEDKQVNPGFLGSLFGIQPGTEQVLKKDPKLIEAIRKYVDYDAGRGREGFPSSTEETVSVPMTDSQQNIYDTMMDKAPFWVRWKIKAGLPPNRQELQSLQAFLTGPRQIANSTYDFVKNKNTTESPKVTQAVNYLKRQIAKNPNYKAVVYSNYLGSGLAPYKMKLDQLKIPYGEFSGNITPKVRDQLVRDYNENKLRALLISSAGAEGLDLKGTRLLQILEPHFNREKEKQIIGRAIRYQSHAALPEDQRNVLVQRYLSQPQGGLFDRLLGKETVKGTDEYISDIANRKEQLNQQLINLIAEQQRNYATGVRATK